MNNEEIYLLVEQLLMEEEDLLIPISKLLYLMKMEKSELNDLTEKELKNILKERKIFLIYDFPEEYDLWPDKDNEKMAEEGLFKGDKVMLLDKKPSAEDLRQMLLGNLDYLYRNFQDLKNNAEDQNLETYTTAMRRAKELYEKFSNLIIDEDYNEDK